ncbi:MAG TPA: hypothetical protein VJ227_00415 [Patescibacteria group bacterium]|nr:hypothetical protein [Patescibacteria group bacterium]
MNWFKPKVTLNAVYTVARAAGIASYSEVLEKARSSGLVRDQNAAALRAKASSAEAAADEEYERAIAAAERKNEEDLAQVEVTRVQARQEAAQAKDVLSAVAEFERAMGK